MSRGALITTRGAGTRVHIFLHLLSYVWRKRKYVLGFCCLVALVVVLYVSSYRAWLFRFLLRQLCYLH